MMRPEPTDRASVPPRERRRASSAAGFTFIEVLFAVIILGVGTIMLAGMLPVAIKQSSDTRDEVAGRAVCEAGFAQMQAIAKSAPNAFPPTDQPTPPQTSPAPTPPSITWTSNPTFNLLGLTAGATAPGRIVPLSYSVVSDSGSAAPTSSSPPAPDVDKLSPHLLAQGSRIDQTDPRFQYLAFYGRATGSSTAKLIILATRLRNVNSSITVASKTVPIDKYSQYTLVNETGVNADNGPMLAEADFIEGGALNPDRIVFTTNALNNTALLTASQNTFVIVATATNAANDPNRARRNIGRIFRLAARNDTDSTGHTFDLQAGYDLGPLANGPDNIPNTADDIVDDSMHAGTNYVVTGSTTATGESVQVWLVGSGLKNPAAAYNATSNPYTGLSQDVSILSVDLPLSN